MAQKFMYQDKVVKVKSVIIKGKRYSQGRNERGQISFTVPFKTRKFLADYLSLIELQKQYVPPKPRPFKEVKRWRGYESLWFRVGVVVVEFLESVDNFGRHSYSNVVFALRGADVEVSPFDLGSERKAVAFVNSRWDDFVKVNSYGFKNFGQLQAFLRGHKSEWKDSPRFKTEGIGVNRSYSGFSVSYGKRGLFHLDENRSWPKVYLRRKWEWFLKNDGSLTESYKNYELAERERYRKYKKVHPTTKKEFDVSRFSE
jgi:hypothetical protein